MPAANDSAAPLPPKHMLDKASEAMYEALEYIFDHIADKHRGPRDLYPAFGLDASRAVEMARAALALARGETNA